MPTLFTRNHLKYTLHREFSNEQIAIAVHEAAHTVVALATESRVEQVWIKEPGGGRRTWTGECGYTHYVDTSAPGERFTRDINDGLIAVAPSVADAFVDWPIVRDAPGWCLRMSDGDHRLLHEVHENSFADYPSYGALLTRMRSTSKHILDQHTGALTRIAYGLLMAGTIEGDVLEALPNGLGVRWKVHEQTETPAPKPGPVAQPTRSRPPAGRPTVPQRPIVRGLEYSAPVELIRVHETRN